MKRWQEVFLQALGVSPSADRLLQLMKAEADLLMAEDEMLQKFLVWVGQKAASVNAPYKLPAVRAFYFAFVQVLDRDRTLDLARMLDPTLARALNLALDLALDLSLARAQTLNLTLNLALDRDLSLSQPLDLDLTLDLALDLSLSRALVRDPALVRTLERALMRACALAGDDRDLQRKLQALTSQISTPSNQEPFEHWWQSNGQRWIAQLRTVMTEHRKIGVLWPFSDEQKQRLQQYCDANKSLVDYLNSDCQLSDVVRQEIEETLLLSIGEIGRYAGGRE